MVENLSMTTFQNRMAISQETEITAAIRSAIIISTTLLWFISRNLWTQELKHADQRNESKHNNSVFDSQSWGWQASPLKATCFSAQFQCTIGTKRNSCWPLVQVTSSSLESAYKLGHGLKIHRLMTGPYKLVHGLKDTSSHYRTIGDDPCKTSTGMSHDS